MRQVNKIVPNIMIDNKRYVLYPNPYLTITPAGYTKHYYIGSERIATAIGEGGWGNALVNKDQHDANICDKYFSNMCRFYCGYGT